MRKQVKFMKRESLLERIVKWIFNKKLLKNKVYSLAMMLIGYFTIGIAEGDCTIFLFTLLLGLPLFFSKENYIV